MIFGIGVWACTDSALRWNDGGRAVLHGVTHMDRYGYVWIGGVF